MELGAGGTESNGIEQNDVYVLCGVPIPPFNDSVSQ